MKLLLAALLLFALAGCAAPESPTPAETSDPHERRITRAEFGDKWPFTVGEGILRHGSDDAVTFEAEGRVYPLNGRARDNMPYSDVLPILADDPRYADFRTLSRRERKMLVQPIIDAGRALPTE